MTKRFATRVLEGAHAYSVVAALMVSVVSLGATAVAQAPVFAVDAAKCATPIDCPPPIPRRGQDPRCLESVCHKGLCATKARVGHALDGVVSGGEFACFSAPLVCDGGGKAVVVTESSRLIAVREGLHCIPSVASNNTCLKPVCRNKVCAHEPNDDAGCPDANVAVTACEKRACRNGACQAVPDPKRQGTSCGDSQTEGCRTTSYLCSATGTCEAARQVAANAECADGPLVLGASNLLPAAFRDLVVSSATFPKYACNVTTCKLEFCGDGVINRDEQCDGVAMPSNAPAGRRCNAACKVE